MTLIGDWYGHERFRSIWSDAVELQAERLQTPYEDQFEIIPDFILYAFALRCLFRSVQGISAAASGALAAELEAFVRAVPDFKDVRDVLDHFDAYHGGDGRLQKASGERYTNAHPVVEGTTLFLQGGALRLDRTTSLDAARTLANAAREVVWRVGAITLRDDHTETFSNPTPTPQLAENE